MSLDRTERFYQLLVQLQFKFLVSIFICILMLQIGTVLMQNVYPFNWIGMALYYGVYCVGVYALTLFRQHKAIIDNPELYIPHHNPPEFNTLYWEVCHTDVLSDKQMEILYEWAKGKTWRSLGVHPTILNRLCRKYVLHTLKKREGLS